MITIRRVIVALVISISPFLMSCSRTNKDADCISREALTNLRLIVAGEQGNLKVMQEMIEAGADVNISDELFGTPLTAAIANAKYEAVKLLVEKGANVNQADGHGSTPLIWAVQSGNPDVVRLLLTKGADPNASNKKLSGKFTPLAIAKHKENDEIIKLLLEAGARE